MVETDYDALLDYLMGFGKQTLENYDELHPFAATMAHDGSIVGLMVDIPDGGMNTDDILSLLDAQLKQQATDGEIKASGICADIYLRNDEDDSESEAIQVQLEHQAGDPINVYLPYQKLKAGSYGWGELTGGDGETKVFARDDAEEE